MPRQPYANVEQDDSRAPDAPGPGPTAQRRFSRGTLLKMVSALFLVVGAYMCFTLLSEGQAVQASQPASGYSSQYLPLSAPSAEELSFRDTVSAALKASPEEAFTALAGGQDSLTRPAFRRMLIGVLHAGIKNVVGADQMAAELGPLAAFGATVQEQSTHMTLEAPLVMDRVFAATDADGDDRISHAELMAAMQNPTLPFAVFDANKDGSVTAEEVAPVIVDAVNATLFLGHEAVDVVVAGVDSVTDVVSSMATGFFGGSIAFEAVWMKLLSVQQMANGFAASVSQLATDPAMAAQRVRLAAQREEDDAAFLEMVENAGNPDGLNVDEFNTFVTRRTVGKSFYNDAQFLEMMETLKSTTPMMDVLPAGIMNVAPAGAAAAAAAAEEAGSGSDQALRGATPTASPQLQALIAAVQSAYEAESKHMSFALMVVLDRNSDGLVSLEEHQLLSTVVDAFISDDAKFTDPMLRLRALLQTLFDMADRDGNGALSKQEVHAALDAYVSLLRQALHSTMTMAAAALPDGVPMLTSMAIAVIDTNADGLVTMEEVFAAIEQMQQQQAAMMEQMQAQAMAQMQAQQAAAAAAAGGGM